MTGPSEGKARRKAKTDDDDTEEEDLSLPLPPSMLGGSKTPKSSWEPTTSATSLNDPTKVPSDDDDPIQKKMDERKSKRIAEKLEKKSAESKEGIKTLPLILLVLLLGTTLLPALLYVSDRMGGVFQKRKFFGSMGQKLGIGPSPKKRVTSFYEKHDPSKLVEVNEILSKYYGDYPTLIKRLERKYGDYGYFLNWEEDDAAWKLAMEKLVQTQKYLQKKFDRYAPQVVQRGVYNAKMNFTRYYRKGKIIWRKKIWPVLEPYFGVPDGSAAQKRKDRQDAMNQKKTGKGGRRKKNEDFRDEEDEF
jgi:hypothetical protein